MPITKHEDSDVLRIASPVQRAVEDLGLLEDLPGMWMGNGFNMIARPAGEGKPKQPTFFLELNATQETLEFVAIGGAIPNRGSTEPTALLHGLRYLQTVADCQSHEFIHKEPGLWLHVPPTGESAEDTYVRQAVIPHGDSLLAQSIFTGTFPTGPDIKPVTSFPFPLSEPIPPLNDLTHAVDETLGYIDPYLHNTLPTTCLPPNLNAGAVIKDPTEVLRAQIENQSFEETKVIDISTRASGGIVNIPFVVKNANAVQMDAIFWIERVKRPGFDTRDTPFLQLQYVQRVILDFAGLHWPHISVATLVKAG
ncbi:MAG TPA: heme-binding protein [Solirubrobacteraceae bacterium]|nr:heme-binding protein [Solirubrobacteraceae bacterium]